MFAFTVPTDIVNDYEPQTIDEYWLKHDWLKWKEVIKAELTSLAKCEVFRPVVQTPKDVKIVRYKWVLVRKHNENDEVIRYKA